MLDFAAPCSAGFGGMCAFLAGVVILGAISPVGAFAGPKTSKTGPRKGAADSGKFVGVSGR